MEPTTQPVLTSAYYMSVIRRRLRIVVAGATIGALLGITYIATRPSGYSSTASVVVRQVQGDPRVATQRGVSAQTERSVMASTVVAQLAADILDRDNDPDDLLKRLTVDSPQDAAVVSAPQDTLVLSATFRASSPERARSGAQAFADAYLDYRQSQYDGLKERTIANIDAELVGLRDSLAQAQAEAARLAVSPNSPEYIAAQQRVELLLPRIVDAEADRSTISAVDTNAGEVIKPARLPTGTVGISRALAVIALTVLGTMAGIVIALVRQRTDPFLRNREDFVELFGRPPLSEIDRKIRRRFGKPRQISPLRQDANNFRHLRIRLWPTRPPKFQRVLISDVTDPVTTARVAEGVASSLAAAQWRVLVIWPDSFESQFDPDVLSRVDGVRLLPWSSVEGYSGEAIDPSSLLKVLDEATTLDDVVLLVAPPIASTAEGPELYSLVDGVLVSFDPAVVRRQVLEDALEEVARMGGEVAGVVVSPVPGRW